MPEQSFTELANASRKNWLKISQNIEIIFLIQIELLSFGFDEWSGRINMYKASKQICEWERKHFQLHTDYT